MIDGKVMDYYKMEDYKRKKKSDKAKRNKDLYGKYNSKKIRQLEARGNTQKIEFLLKK
jgi:hypothetical protein